MTKLWGWKMAGVTFRFSGIYFARFAWTFLPCSKMYQAGKPANDNRQWRK